MFFQKGLLTFDESVYFIFVYRQIVHTFLGSNFIFLLHISMAFEFNSKRCGLSEYKH